MNKNERIKMVKAMEFIMRNLNDNGWFELWLQNGVADGDITYGDLSEEDPDEVLDYYIEDRNYEDLMAEFVGILKQASTGSVRGTLFNDGCRAEYHPFD